MQDDHCTMMTRIYEAFASLPIEKKYPNTRSELAESIPRGKGGAATLYAGTGGGGFGYNHLHGRKGYELRKDAIESAVILLDQVTCNETFVRIFSESRWPSPYIYADRLSFTVYGTTCARPFTHYN